MPAPPAPAPSGGSDPCRRTPSRSTAPDRALLARLAPLLAEGHDGAGGLVLVGLERAEAHAVDVHLRPLVGPDPLDELAGWHAPGAWFGVGVTAAGFVERPGNPRRAATIAVVAGRDGAISVGVAGDGEPSPWTARAPDAVGRVADACLRAFGLATAPCPDPPLAAWAATWLDVLVARLAASPRHPARSPAPSWADIADAHPLVDLLTPAERADPAALRRLADHPLARGPWEAMRRAAGRGRLPAWAVPSRTAEWLDAGSFARHIWGRLPAVAELWGALTDLLPPALQREVRSVAAAWALPAHPNRP